MINKGLFKSIVVFFLGLMLIGCGKELPPGEYDANEIGKIKKVIPGTIISMRKVNLRKQTSEAVADHSKTTSDSLMEGGYNQTRGVEYVIKLHSGGIISVVQAEDLKLKNKQKILVIYGRNTRVVADNGSDIY
jgi:outer membrane lipoprotein SlyB